MAEDAGRYAIYFAPEPASALARFGTGWLGYDVATGESTTQTLVAGIDRGRLAAITAEPRRYGFHATLKPPFALAEGADAAGLDEAVRSLAGGLPGFAAPMLRLSQISGFWALTLCEPCPATDRFAAACVGALDHFRAPPPPDEVTRRRRAGLSSTQEGLLARWGYPYVMEEFRFHMTLTARLAGEESEAVGRALAPLVAPFCQAPLLIDAVSLFRQVRRDAPFRLLRRYALAG